MLSSRRGRAGPDPGLECAPVARLMEPMGSPEGVSKAGSRRSASSTARVTKTGFLERSYAESSPPSERIVVSKKDTSRGATRRLELTCTARRRGVARRGAEQSSAERNRQKHGRENHE